MNLLKHRLPKLIADFHWIILVANEKPTKRIMTRCSIYNVTKFKGILLEQIKVSVIKSGQIKWYVY